MLANYMFDGFKIAVIVSAVLIGYIALLDLINVIFHMSSALRLLKL